jgi:hypothetical protein
MKPIIVITIATALFFAAVAAFHHVISDEKLCVDEGGIWEDGACHPVKR